MAEILHISRDGNIATVVLSRPDKHNAIKLELFAALSEAGKELASDKSVRAVILRGDGPSFCAGIDLGVLQSSGESLTPEMLLPVEGSVANFFQHAAYVWREVPVPVICALHGNVFGAGLQIALAADLRYATADCRLSVMEINWGIIPDLAISTTLTRLLPADKAKELAWTGRVMAAEEAASLGVITAVVGDADAAARKVAEEIAGRSPGAIRAIKRLFDESAELPVAAALRLEAELQMQLLGGQHQLEAVAARLQDRPPVFDD
jgi:enoyl-CoA hydratase/carnithine racemase